MPLPPRRPAPAAPRAAPPSRMPASQPPRSLAAQLAAAGVKPSASATSTPKAASLAATLAATTGPAQGPQLLPGAVNTSQTDPRLVAATTSAPPTSSDAPSAPAGGGGSTPQNPHQDRQVLESKDSGGGQQEGGQDDQQDQSDDQDSTDDSQDQQASDDGDSTVEGERSKRRFSAFIHGETMCGLAMCETPWGNLPLVTAVPIGATAEKNGVPQFGEDPQVDSALEETKRRLMAGDSLETQRLAAESLVRRANQGDQNAMALIQMIGVNARAGDEKAKMSAHFITRYTAAYPKGSENTIHGDRHEHFVRGAVRLANGPPLTNTRIRAIASTFGGKHTRNRKIILKTAHTFGADTPQVDPTRMNEVEKKLYDLGRCIGMAVGIQCVRNGGPISKLSQRAAWELGE